MKTFIQNGDVIAMTAPTDRYPSGYGATLVRDTLDGVATVAA